MVKLHKKPKKEPKTLYQKMLKRYNTNKRMSTFEAKQRAKFSQRAKSAILEAETLMDYYKDLLK